jgi:hypothetical protein
MPPCQWHFREFKPGDNASDPDFARALFARDESAIARSLVREAIQNSLDARASSAAPVHVRFALRTGARAQAQDAVQPFFKGAWRHLRASNSGLEEPPEAPERVPFLVVEDFGTKGLTGSPTTWDPFDAAKNSFFLFFRALGRSGKEGEDRGRWGVGKFVFPMASRAHCLLAFTVPETSRQPLVMGRMVLKTHRADNVSYHPDGHWGYRESSLLVLPAEDSETAIAIQTAFDLKRRNESGLSVIVPWVRDGFTRQSILHAIVGEYFLPILRDELIVEVDDNGVVESVNASGLAGLAESLDQPVVRARVTLGLEAATWPESTIPVLKRPIDGEYEWGEPRLSEEMRSAASLALEAGEVAAFRVPTTVRPKNRDPKLGYFDVFLKHVAGLGRTKPLIVREGITVSEDKTIALQDYACLVVVDERALATFVGDAETPAHTELQYDLVRNKYTLAGKLIQFLRIAASGIVREIEGGDVEADHALLAEFFPRATPSAKPRKPKPVSSDEGDSTEEIPDVPDRLPRFRIGKVDNGFYVRGTGKADIGTHLTIYCAYDVRRGNPIRKYRRTDFEVGQDIKVEVEGLKLGHTADNAIVAVVENPEFLLSAKGFDTNRNVVVRVTASVAEGTEE